MITSARLRDLDKREDDLVKQIQSLQYKLQQLRDERRVEERETFVRYPTDVEEVCAGFRGGRFSKTRVAAFINFHWGTDCLTYKGRSFFAHCLDLIEATGAEDNLCHGFLDLCTGQPVFVSDEDEDTICKWRRNDMAICIFSK